MCKSIPRVGSLPFIAIVTSSDGPKGLYESRKSGEDIPTVVWMLGMCESLGGIMCGLSGNEPDRLVTGRVVGDSSGCMKCGELVSGVNGVCVCRLVDVGNWMLGAEGMVSGESLSREGMRCTGRAGVEWGVDGLDICSSAISMSRLA